MEVNDKTSETCPLCSSMDGFLYSKDKNRSYIRCNTCQLVFVPERFFISADVEKARYDRHDNSPDAEGYITFLHRLIDPLLKRIDNNLYGLDFGSGPVPVFASLLEKAGHTIETFDIFYDNRPELLKGDYDFITVCEVIEHLHHPFAELSTLFKALKQGGLLAVMTQPPVPSDRFPGWRYKNDPTHVLFFSDETFRWISEAFGYDYSNPEYGVYFLKKN